MQRLSVVVCLLVLPLVFANGQQSPGCKRLKDHGFPAPETLLLQMRDMHDQNRMREHAWALFTGLTKRPVWESWYNKCDVGLMTECPAAVLTKGGDHRDLIRGIEIPVQSMLTRVQLSAQEQTVQRVQSQASQLQSNVLKFVELWAKQPQFASVLFNQEARDHILTNCLYSATVLSKKPVTGCPELLTSQSAIPAFPRGAIALKTMWALVHAPTEGRYLAGPLDTWDSRIWNVVQPANSDASVFKKSVTIDTRRGTKCKNQDYGDNEAIPISCFYFYKLTDDDVRLFASLPRGLARVVDKGIVRGDYLILVAMHVTTKEIPDWVWATFWWDNRAITDPYGLGRPKSVKNNWKHYLMNTTFSDTASVEQADLGPKICFNPYLESFPNGFISNCMRCHRGAVFSEPSKEAEGIDMGILARNGKILASDNPIDLEYFNGSLGTDFLWSLSSPHNKELMDILDAIRGLGVGVK